MPFAYYDRLSPARKATYRRSDAIDTLALPPGLEHGATVAAIRAALAADRQPEVQRGCQVLCDALTAGYRVPPVRVLVMERRPSDDYGELHGLYEPATKRRRARISVWMRTAAKQQVVAFRSFLRTVVHELGHHLDYELLELEETFHTEGFFKRESSLFDQLVPPSAPAGDAGGS
jgi:hypothetical protein